MKHSIRSRLLKAFFIVIFTLSMTGVSLLLMHSYVVQKYKNNTDSMVNEYNLINNASNLISVYNARALSSASFSTAEEDKKIQDIKTDINNLTQILDKSITDKQSVAAYIGLKNTISAVIAEVDTGLESLANNKPDASTHYSEANRKYTFVKDNGTVLIFSELQYIASVQKQINKTYQLSREVGVTSFFLIVTGSVLYVLRISKRIVSPLRKLTATAEQISGGNMEAVIDHDLLQQKDEAGSLSNSFNLMFQSLKEHIHEVSVEKAGVEKKVEERTAELSNEKARLAASVNSLNIGFVMTDLNEDILSLNQEARNILAYLLTSEGVSKINAEDLERQWTLQDVEQRLGDSVKLGDSLKKVLNTGLPIAYKAVDYHGRILSIFLAPIFSGITNNTDKLGTIILLEDITEEKVLERSKDEFFSIASHELRTPLTSIKGNSSMILDYYKEVLKDPQLKEMVEDMHASSVRLINIVNDFLDLSRLEQGKMSFDYKPTAINKIIESVKYEMDQVLKEKKIYLKLDQLNLDALPDVWVDENRLKQVVYNLVGNAAKFTEEGGITISVRLSSDKNSVKVHMVDTGRGMTADSQQLLFHKFQQASSSLLTRDTTRGTGLGLYISKMIIESMGGKIVLEHSEPNKGSAFSFTVPIATAEQQAAPAISKSTIDTSTGLTKTNPDTP